MCLTRVPKSDRDCSLTLTSLRCSTLIRSYTEGPTGTKMGPYRVK